MLQNFSPNGQILQHHMLLSTFFKHILPTFCLAKPGSITYTTPSMVSDVSAIFVDTTHLRPIAPLGLLGGGGSNILCCRLGGKVEYRGIHFISPTSGPRLSTSLWILLQASSISYRERTVVKSYKLCILLTNQISC